MALAEARLHWWHDLSAPEKDRLCDLTRDFLETRRFEGVLGFQPAADMAALVALQACLLILGLDLGWYRDVTAVVLSPGSRPGHAGRSLDGGIRSDAPVSLSGQAMLHGPVLIAWDVTVRDMARPEAGRNVVLHEFAHKLDMRSGTVSGEPLLDAELARRWRPTMSNLLASLRYEDDPVIDSYGAVNPAELLAVVTEAFFLLPGRLQEAHPEVYEILVGFYRQDPASRAGNRA